MMKIAQVAPLVESVPPQKYGGTERVVSTLTEELVSRGHEVTLFASGDSKTQARLISVTDRNLRSVYPDNFKSIVSTTLIDLGIAYMYQDAFDVIHDHTGILGAAFANLSHIPVVMTIHGKITDDYIKTFGTFTKPSLVSISYAQRHPAPYLNYVSNVYNGLDMEDYPFSSRDRGYLLYVGRICPEKGTHFAVEVAEKLNMPLVIAAKLERHLNGEYFDTFIKPKLGKVVKWIGEVNEQERNSLYQNATAFLHPITWPEPFGLTLIEAMACGCPVIAFGQGSIPEVVSHGVSGYVVKTVQEMIEAIKNIHEINRYKCRTYALNKFNARRMTDGYESIYSRLIWQKQSAGKTSFN